MLKQLGISTVYQEVNLCPNLTVAENILIGREPMKWGSINWKAMNTRARQILQGLDIDLDVTQTLGLLFSRHPADGSDCTGTRDFVCQDPDPG